MYRRHFSSLRRVDCQATTSSSPFQSFADAWCYVSTGWSFKIPTKCTRPRTIKSSPRKNRCRWKAPCAKPHPRTSPRWPPARSSYILAEVALRRKQHKHNAVELVDHTRRMHSLTLSRMHAYKYIYIRFAFAYTYAYHSKNSTRLSTRRDITLRGGRKMSIDKANINE